MILDPRSMIHTVHVLHSTFIVSYLIHQAFMANIGEYGTKKTPKWNKNMQYAVSDIYMSKKKSMK